MKRIQLKKVYKTLRRMLIEVKMKKVRSAFTLAEVLITLGIIGVVAAMTLPTLINKTNGLQYRTKFKKTLSTLNQGVRMSQAKYDLDFTLSGFTSTSKIGNSVSSFNLDPNVEISHYAIFSSTMKGDWVRNSNCSPGKNYSTCTNYETGLSSYTASGMVNFRFLDGAEVYVSDVMPAMTQAYLDYKGCTKDTPNTPCYGWIDVNGYNKGPNKEVKCSDGTRKLVTESGYSDCTVDASHMTDIYPVWFHDATVEPLTNASIYILGAK